MSRPVVSATAERTYARLGAYADQDEANGWPLLFFCEARARGLAKSTAALRHDSIGSGKRRMRSPTRCPAWRLPSLSQYAGVDLPPGATEDEQRALIRDAPQQRRGTPAAMLAAVALTLTGSRAIRLLERDESAWDFTVVTRTAETPDPSATEAAIRSQKPVGLLFTHDITDFALIDEWTRSIDSITANIDTLTIPEVT